jgi:NADH-quinone oxidoreductase subunit C
MTKPLLSGKVAEQINAQLPNAVIESEKDWIIVRPEALSQVAQFLKTTPGLEFDYLTAISGIDYLDYLETVYHLISIKNNHSLVLKARCRREKPQLPSVVDVWRGADFQEREIYDLLGITFVGHPNLKRIFLWEGFQGYPLRRDYL